MSIYIMKSNYNRHLFGCYQSTNTPTHQHTNTPTYQYTRIRTHQCTNTPIHQYTNTPIHQYTNTPTFQENSAPTVQSPMYSIKSCFHELRCTLYSLHTQHVATFVNASPYTPTSPAVYICAWCRGGHCQGLIVIPPLEHD